MLASAIISSGRDLADLPGTGFFTDAEALRALNNGYADLYAKLTEKEDDFFLTRVPDITVTPVTDWNNVYQYALPADFYRLRMVKYKRGNSTYLSVDKLSLEDFGNSQNFPGYRIVGANLWIYDPGYPSEYEVWYYPVATTWISTDNITYPGNVAYEILSYQVAIEARRKQGRDVTLLEQRKAEMLQTMLMATDRDQFKPQPIQNVFGTRGGGWR